MSIFALYQDPLRGERLKISGYNIGSKMIPEEFDISDPILLRLLLCLIIVIHDAFHMFLCCRQLKLCEKSKDPPPEMEGVMSQDAFKASKDKQFHSLYLEMFNLIMDVIYSCLDLYLCTLPYLWELTVGWYANADLTWLNVTFMTLFSTYLVIRMLPALFYEKLFLNPKYHEDREDTPPLLGLICALAFFVVFLQIGIIPVTAIFMALEAESVWYFNLFVWLLLVVGSLLLLVAVGLFGVPCIGKSRELKDSDRSESLRKVLTDLKFPGRVYAVYTFHVGRPTAWVMGCFCCLRLDIHDNLTLNRGLGSTDLAFSHVGEGLNDEQLAAFVAHQLAHWHLWHSVKTLVMIHLSLLVYLVLFGFSYKWSTLYKAAGFSKLYPCVVGFWLVYKYLMRPFHTLTTWIVLFFIRHFEYAADAYIVKRGYGEGIRSALLKLFSDDFEFPYVDHWYLMWHLYRPSVLQRILNLERLEHKQRVSRLSLV